MTAEVLAAASYGAGEVEGEALSEYHIEAQTSLVERSLRSLKHGNAFAVLDSYGDLGVFEGPEGLFFEDTRYLSRFQLTVEGQRPLLLGSVMQDDNAALSIDLTTADIHPSASGEEDLPRDLVFLDRTKFLWKGALYERIGLRSYDTRPRRLRLAVEYDADFRDLFEVRGSDRERRGTRAVSVEGSDEVAFRYTGLDEVVRTARLFFSPTPAKLEAHRAEFAIHVPAGGHTSLFVRVACHSEAKPRTDVASAGDIELPDPPPPAAAKRVGEGRAFALAYRDTRRDLRAATRDITTVESSNEQFNEVACRATSDLYMLMSRTPQGLYPYAGIPWFSTVFGRDGIITAMMTLWIDPNIAKGVLRTLAATQATKDDPEADAQPGKILHETRHGEMAMLGEVPFKQYYGTVDATPLFVMLAGMYHERTGDRATIREIWPNIEAALAWIEASGDRDGDGFVEYYRATDNGLANQGWKDSHDSIFHADGKLAQGPIALCEVQGYVYAAKRAAARMAADLGDPGRGDRLEAEALILRDKFEKAFWCEEIGTYALALDGDKKPCRVRSSNAGHALFTGIAAPDKAAIVARTLLSRDAFSGWGVRTIAQGEARYNPMSYHNGSVWPHDNGLVAMGLARYGLKDEAARVFDGMFGAALYQDGRRLPELFCGFIRGRRRGPTSYPVACTPQAWAAAAPFGFLSACLGLELRHDRNQVRFRDPVMPAFLDEVLIRNVRLGASSLDLRLHRFGRDVTVNVIRRVGDAQVSLVK
jgi:glycogen debranching enzyme